ncbi:MAG: RNA-binding transcriptional accessory protein, partial [Lachnospiraceae bacterium]|nr:RNA-binding transcriptional accessory protein [Lachnospiraceae bacterium]
MDIIKIISEELKVRPNQVEAAVKLIDEGNTIPFIARYRKDVTDNLNDEQLRNLDERLTYLRNLEERKSAVIDSITEQEKMTPELLKKIEEATTLVEVEDLYRPYKPKRRTRAMIAKEKGLEPLALDIMKQKLDVDAKEAAKAYISEEKEVANEEEALNGAMDIIAEAVSDDANYRTYIRKLTFREGILISKAKDEEAESVYENYYDFTSTLDKLSGYQILAINRGEKEKFLTVKIEPPKDKAVRYLMNHVKKKENPNTDSYIDLALEDSYD